MKIAVYGGSFNPPHKAHFRLVQKALEQLMSDLFLVVPASDPPHKKLEAGSPGPEERLLLTRLNFEDLPSVIVSGIEIERGGESFTSDTIEQLKREFVGSEISLVVGSDMLFYFEKWHKFEWLLKNTEIAVMSRESGEKDELCAYADFLQKKYGAKIKIISADPLTMSSTQIRKELRERRASELIREPVYSRIIKTRSYGAKPNLDWLMQSVEKHLKPARVPHVLGCRAEAVKLALRWGIPADDAEEAAILHDLTKKLSFDEHLLLAETYGIIFDNFELNNVKLMHAKTGAYLARDLYGISDGIFEAILWHTTGKTDMSLLEKILYIADYIEPTRSFEGVCEMRELAYSDLDAALRLGLKLSVHELVSNGIDPATITLEALYWYGGK